MALTMLHSALLDLTINTLVLALSTRAYSMWKHEPSTHSLLCFDA